MRLAILLASFSLSLSLPTHAAALPHNRRGPGRHNFVLVRSPQAIDQDATNVITTVADSSISMDPLANSTSITNTTSIPQDPVDGGPVLVISNGTSPVSNETGYDTLPPQLSNVPDSVLSAVVSSLVASTSAYETFSYSEYLPSPTASPTSTYSAPTYTSISTPEIPVDPIAMAKQAAQSYAQQQELKKQMPTVTVELVLVPTQEPDGSWDYVIHVGPDGTATASPTMITPTATSRSTYTSDAEPALPPAPTSPYIHDTQAGDYLPVQDGTSAAPAQSAPAAPYVDPAVDAPSPSQNWGGPAPYEAPQGDGAPPPQTPTTDAWSPDATPSPSYYAGHGYISAFSSEGRGAATFVYSSAESYPTTLPANDEPLYQIPEPVATAWTSGKGQQHAYPWMTESAAPDLPLPTSTGWTSGRGQQHAYPWTTQVNSEPTPTIVSVAPVASPTADANGVVVATLAPIAQSTDNVPVSDSPSNPWLVSASPASEIPTTGNETDSSGDDAGPFGNNVDPSDNDVASPTESISNAAPSPSSESAASAGDADSSNIESVSSAPVESPSPTTSYYDGWIVGAPAVTTASEASATDATESSQITISPSASVTQSDSLSASSGYQPSSVLSANGTAVETGASDETSGTINTSVAIGTLASPSSITLIGTEIEAPIETGILTLTEASVTLSALDSMSTSVPNTDADGTLYASATTWASSSASPTEVMSAVGPDIASSTVDYNAASFVDSFVFPSASSTSGLVDSSESMTSPAPTTVTTESSIPTDSSSSLINAEEDEYVTETYTDWTTVGVTATSYASSSVPTPNVVTSIESMTVEPPSTPTASTFESVITRVSSSDPVSSGSETVLAQAGILPTQVLLVTQPASATETASYTQLPTASWSASESVTAYSSSATDVIWDTTPITSASSTVTYAEALQTAVADIPYCEEGEEGWEEVWVTEEEIQPDWIVLE